MRKRRNIWLFGCMLVLVACGSANSVKAQLVEVSTAQLATEAQAIVRGEVSAIRSEWNADRNYIWSFVTLSVSQSLKGEDVSGQDIEIKIPGGVVDEIAQVSSDQVKFEEGEEVVVFLGQESYRERQYFNVVNLVQGKLTVEDGRVQGKAVETFLQEVTQALRPGN